MRVLIVTGIFPPDIGGPASYVPALGRHLVQRAHHVTVLTLSDRVGVDDSAHPFPVVRLLRATPRPLRLLRTIATIARLSRQADLLFVNGLVLEAVIASRLVRRPVLVKVVGDLAWERATAAGLVADLPHDFQCRRYGPRVELLKMLRGWWTRAADLVLVPSRYLAAVVETWGVSAARIRVIPNSAAPPGPVEPAEIPLRGCPRLVTVGRLVAWKGVAGILEALRSLPDVPLVVVGDGPERARLEALACELEVRSRVYFAGACERGRTLSLLRACDLLVLNSTYEGLPHVVLEAMSLGLPVVATAVGGTPELVRDGETGLLVPPGDTPALARALRTLCDDAKIRRRMGRAGRRRLRSFDPADTLGAAEQLMRTLVHEC